MKVDDALVAKVAGLARLQLSPDERVAIKADLEKILRFVDTLQDVDPAKLASLEAQPNDETPERDDQVRASLSPELAMANAARTQGTSFEVPRIIE